MKPSKKNSKTNVSVEVAYPIFLAGSLETVFYVCLNQCTICVLQIFVQGIYVQQKRVRNSVHPGPLQNASSSEKLHVMESIQTEQKLIIDTFY